VATPPAERAGAAEPRPAETDDGREFLERLGLPDDAEELSEFTD
jgi:hypothetical protein